LNYAIFLTYELYFGLYRIPVYSGFGLYRIPVYSGFGLYRIPVYSGFGLYRIPVYSGFGLYRFHCIINEKDEIWSCLVWSNMFVNNSNVLQ
jgi:hypothetical protein